MPSHQSSAATSSRDHAHAGCRAQWRCHRRSPGVTIAQLCQRRFAGWGGAAGVVAIEPNTFWQDHSDHRREQRRRLGECSVSARRLAGAGAQLIITARDQKRANAGAARIQAPLVAVGLELDLASLESVRGLPARLSDALGPDVAIDALINNAQGESPLYSKKVDQSGERTTTKDGFDRILGTAHLSHFALVAALLPALKRSRRAACLRWHLGYTAVRQPGLLGMAGPGTWLRYLIETSS